jgi:putative CocE/NonD family hydrolase
VSILRRALESAAGLPAPSLVGQVSVERDLEAKMPDGVVLLADRWYLDRGWGPASAHADPIVLIRTPYGRRQFAVLGRVFAERGYQAVIQSVRGTFGSGGCFEPFRHEASDGRATLEWMAEQEFCPRPPVVAMFGPSYLGLVQWAVASRPPEHLKALAAQVTAARVREAVVFPGGSFSLESGANWVDLVDHQELPPRQLVRAMLGMRRRARVAYTTLPLQEADVASLGHRIPFYQEWLRHEQPGDPWWDEVDWSKDLSGVPPMTMIGGWYDIFLPEQVADFCRLRQAGCEVRLTIGPWTHASFRGGAAGVRDALDWFGTHLRGERGVVRSKPVRFYFTGSRRWVDVDDWPPPHETARWHLHPDGKLSSEGPMAGPPSSFRYDPADPAPGLGGATLDLFTAGRRDQRRREQRSDVLVFTSDPLRSPLDLAGPLQSELWVRATTAYFDVFVRLCDVDRRGKSTNRADGILRLGPLTPGEAHRVIIEMWPLAHTFGAGHRIRLQVSSAAHPLYARNTGSGERLATASRLVVSEHEVLHGPEHPSSLLLPVSRL